MLIHSSMKVHLSRIVEVTVITLVSAVGVMRQLERAHNNVSHCLCTVGWVASLTYTPIRLWMWSKAAAAIRQDHRWIFNDTVSFGLHLAESSLLQNKRPFSGVAWLVLVISSNCTIERALHAWGTCQQHHWWFFSQITMSCIHHAELRWSQYNCPLVRVSPSSSAEKQWCTVGCN